MRLEGRLTTLRKPSRRDVDAIYHLVSDRQVLRYLLLPAPYERHHAEQFVERALAGHRSGAEFHFVIADQRHGTLLGAMGLNRVDRRHKKTELGYWLGRPHWGRGFTSDALVPMLRFAFQHLRMNKVFARVVAQNTASWKLLRRHGFRREGVLRRDLKLSGRWHDQQLWGLLRTDR